MQQRNEMKGITLIALVITIIVLLILAGVTIATLTGENGILNRATESKAKTVHANVLEQLQLETEEYIVDRNTGKTTLALIEYLQSKSIIGEEIGEDSGKYQINVVELLRATQKYGNGTATESEKNDVYMLEKIDTSTGSLINTKVASTTPLKIAATTNSALTYKVIYYGTSTSEILELGTLSDTAVVDESAKLLAFFAGKSYEEVMNSQTIDGSETTWLFFNEDNGDVFGYILFNDKVYKIAFNENDLAAQISLAETDLNNDLPGKYFIDGIDVLLTKDGLIHKYYESGTFTDDDGNEITGYITYDYEFGTFVSEEVNPITGNNTYYYVDNYMRYYDESGILICSKLDESNKLSVFFEGKFANDVTITQTIDGSVTKWLFGGRGSYGYILYNERVYRVTYDVDGIVFEVSLVESDFNYNAPGEYSIDGIDVLLTKDNLVHEEYYGPMSDDYCYYLDENGDLDYDRPYTGVFYETEDNDTYKFYDDSYTLINVGLEKR